MSALMEDAERIMAEHPSVLGWHRVEAQRCGGKHGVVLPGVGPTVLWRRHRDLFDRTYRPLDVEDDPPLWVAERVGTALCVTDGWAWRIRTAMTLDVLRRDVGVPWAVSDGPVQPGTTVTLTTINGTWIWSVTGEPNPCCGGHLARWAD